MVTYGAMTYAPISVGAGDVVYKALTIRGFFLGHPQHAAKFPALIKQAGALIEAKKLSVPIAAVYPLSAVKEALAHVQRGGKVLLDIAGH
jgi:NADPH:quinone reductase-like Zn-dependent oxidoreductase